MDIVEHITHMPPFTRFYLVMIVVTTFLISYVPYLPTYWLFALSIKQIVQSYQYWRLVTNFLIAGKFSISFGFFVITLYMQLSRLERDCINRRKYADFVMILVYICLFLIGISFINYYVFGYTENRSLLEPLAYALMSIHSYKHPNEKTSVFFIPVKNLYAPVALALVVFCSGGSFQSILVGLCAGYLFVFIKDIIPSYSKRIQLVWVPSVLKRLCKDSVWKQKTEEEPREQSRREPYVNLNPNDNTNTAFRERNTVIEGNEFRPYDPNDIPL